MGESFFEHKKYDVRPETKFFDVSQVQTVKYKTQSDTMWDASPNYRFLFRNLLANASNDD